MQQTFQLHDGELQNVIKLDELLNDGWIVISSTKINYGKTTLFILEKNTLNTIL